MSIYQEPIETSSLDYERRLMRSIRRIIRAVDQHSKALHHQEDITTPQLVCLSAVIKHGPLTLKALSKDVDLSSSTLVGIVDRLELKGLVTRQRSVQDRRQVMITATDLGQQTAHRSPSPLQQKLTQTFSTLPELEQATLALALERVVSLLGVEQLDASAILSIDEMNLHVIKEK